MSVFVDEMRGPSSHRVRCHMIADAPDELRAFAALIGLPLGRVLAEGTDYEHFDLSDKYRDAAIAAGAQVITLGDLARKMSERRHFVPCERKAGCRRAAGHYGRCLVEALVEEAQPHNRDDPVPRDQRRPR